jgi:hypothetical protein
MLCGTVNCCWLFGAGAVVGIGSGCVGVALGRQCRCPSLVRSGRIGASGIGWWAVRVSFHVLDIGDRSAERWRWARFEVCDFLSGEGEVDVGIPVESGVSL